MRVVLHSLMSKVEALAGYLAEPGAHDEN